MVERRFFEVECCNPQCPQGRFQITRKVVGVAIHGTCQEKVECLYCRTTNLVTLPAIALADGLTLKGKPLPGVPG